MKVSINYFNLQVKIIKRKEKMIKIESNFESKSKE